jgi:hypothetical protein
LDHFRNFVLISFKNLSEHYENRLNAGIIFVVSK